MSAVLVLLSYKLKMFFGPSYRGKYGPLPLIGLMLAFLPSGFGLGFGLGGFLADADPELVISTIGMAFGTMLAMGLVFALGVGVTAHSSELDFLMTTPIRPRHYLIADMLFEFASITLAGGLALFIAVFGFLVSIDKPLWLVMPLVLVAMLFGAMVLMIVQIVTALKIGHPRSRARTIALVLFLLAMVPMASFVDPSFKESFATLPIPQASFASLVYDIVFQDRVAIVDVAVSSVYLLMVGSVWYAVSGTYIFHGVRPTLTAGFGQIDMGAKMAQQRRLIGLFGKSTGTISLDFRKGGDIGLMTRLNLIRSLRDGSFFFIGLLVAIFLFSGSMQGSSGGDVDIQINALQSVGWPIAILALNWCYYERENLWIAVVSGRSLVTYFRGLMLSLLLIGLAIAFVVAFVLRLAGASLGMNTLSFMVGSIVGDALVATMLMTRIRVKPGAFSPGLVALLFVTFIAGGGIGGAFLMVELAVASILPVILDAIAVVVMAIGVTYLGFLVVDRLARTFVFA